MTDFVLHVGLPKTATTTLQRTFFPHHSQVYFVGKNTRYPGRNGCRSAEMHRALAPAIWDTSRPFDETAIRDGLGPATLAEMAGHKVVLGSWEALGTMADTAHFSEMLRRLARLFGRCRVMVTVRNPYTWVPSLYLQQLQGNFVKRDRRLMQKRPFHGVEDWFHGMDREDGNRLFAFGRNLGEAVDLFGKANVGVFVYEELAVDPRGYFGRMCEFLGVDLDECLELTSTRHFNPRISQAQLDMMRRVDASWPRRLAWLVGSRRYRSRLLKGAAASVRDDRPAVVALPERLRQEIAGQAGATYRWFAEEFGLALDRHGYPL